MFPEARLGAGMYESFYLRAVSPREPLGVWIRHTVHKAPGVKPSGSVWCTVFDAGRGAPFTHKLTAGPPRVPPGGWIQIGEQAAMGPTGAEGSCGPARWSLRFRALAEPLAHLRPGLLYRAPLPRTKLTSPAPLARFDGRVQVDGRPAIELDGWSGMVGHNWGAQHAERWVWLHGCDFSGQPDAWVDVAVGRIALGGRTTPWVASGALFADGRLRRLGGLLGSRPRVSESGAGVELELGGVRLRATVPDGSAAGWRYADPDGGEHNVVNCSVAALEARYDGRMLRSEHGGAYELGTRDPLPGIAIAPFPDG